MARNHMGQAAGAVGGKERWEGRCSYQDLDSVSDRGCPQQKTLTRLLYPENLLPNPRRFHAPASSTIFVPPTPY